MVLSAEHVMKTNAVRILEKLNIVHELREYQVDPGDLSAEAVARKVEVPLSQTYKTLLCKGDKTGHLFAVIAGDCEVDLKILAAAAKDRACALVPLKDVQPLTGYVRGGVTVLGAKKNFPAYIDKAVLELDKMCVSGGMRGLQIVISPDDYIKATGARVVAGLARHVAQESIS
jgi:Cys-tRNA(Pro)/Cys-tRNA(Cys) deacylase